MCGAWLNDFIDLSLEPGRVGAIADPTLEFVIRERLGLPADLAVTPDYSEFKGLVIE